jgi:hypothetical protein
MTPMPIVLLVLGSLAATSACEGAPPMTSPPPTTTTTANTTTTAMARVAPSGADDETSWIDLFDGVSLDGWTRRGGTAEFRVEDGCIVGVTRPDQPNTFLCTDRAFGDFELQFEFKVDRELNSGVQIRSRSRPEFKNGRVHGWQIEIDPSPRGWTGGLYDEGRRGWLKSPSDDTPSKLAFLQGGWNRIRVVAEGPRVRTWLNDVPVVDHVDLAPEMDASGFIGLQVHGVGPRVEPLEVRWRNLRLRELDLAMPDRREP